METISQNSTNYALIEELSHYLLSLTPTQLTVFYCETCHERLNLPTEQRPKGPFQEASGECSHCKRFNDVSNPFINEFLNERNQLVEDPTWETIDSRQLRNETKEIIRNWLIPYRYSDFRQDDHYHGETAAFTWVRYGRERMKLAYRTPFITDHCRPLLVEFYPRCYSAERFATDPIDESTKRNPLKLVTSWAERTVSSSKISAFLPVLANKSLSTFAHLKTFLASKL